MGIKDWIAQCRARKLSDQFAYEANSFLVRLRGLDPQDLGMVAALAADLQYRLFRGGR
jgi:hypothetical protein